MPHFIFRMPRVPAEVASTCLCSPPLSSTRGQILSPWAGICEADRSVSQRVWLQLLVAGDAVGVAVLDGGLLPGHLECQIVVCSTTSRGGGGCNRRCCSTKTRKVRGRQCWCTVNRDGSKGVLTGNHYRRFTGDCRYRRSVLSQKLGIGPAYFLAWFSCQPRRSALFGQQDKGVCRAGVRS